MKSRLKIKSMRENYISVAFNLPVNKFFWYRLPSEFEDGVEKGQRVVAPFRKKNMIGFVVEKSSTKPKKNLKEIKELFDKASPFSLALFKLAEWVSSYYVCSLGQALHSIFPFPFPFEEKNFPSFSSYDSCEKKKRIYLVEPGRAKFDFVLSMIKKAKENGKQVIVLVPEINSIPLFQRKIEGLKINLGVFHSRLSPRKRYSLWLLMREGKIDVAVGTRSLVFAPLPQIGMILVNEEESTDYKQKETPKYNVCQVAIKRGQIEGFPVYLVTNSPSLESWYKAKKGIYRVLCLSGERKFPTFQIVDLKKEKKKNRIFSSLLQEKIKKTVEKRETALLFVPRKGYANFLLCSECGEVVRCPECNIGFRFYLRGEMVCHFCGLRKRAPRVCPFCEGVNLKKIGWGTEKVEFEARKLFPEAKIRRYDLDVLKSSSSLLEKIREEKPDIIIGTHLLIKDEILSLCSLVAVMLFDVLLNLPDFRATEYAFHFLNKISQNLKEDSSLIVQAYNSSHYVLTARSFEEFYEKELEIRKVLGYPPFQSWIRVLAEGGKKDKVKEKIEEVTEKLKKKNIKLLGPSPCPFFKTKGKYRYHVILRDEDEGNLQEAVKEIVYEVTGRSVKVGVDVDPVFVT